MSRTCLCLLSLPHLFLLLLLVPFVKSNIDLMQRTCQQSDQKELCISTLQSDHRSSDANVSRLATIAIQFAFSTAWSLEGYASRLGKSSMDCEEELKELYQGCAKAYSEAANQLAESLKALETLSYGDVLRGVESAIDMAEVCMLGFEVQPAAHPYPLELASRGKTLVNLCGVARHIIQRQFLQ